MKTYLFVVLLAITVYWFKDSVNDYFSNNDVNEKEKLSMINLKNFEF